MRVIIVGCGRLGSELADRMSHDGDEVVVVDKDPKAFLRLGEGFKGRTIAGVGFDRDVLTKAGVERADALAAVTSGDNSNIVAARTAHNIFHVPKVVARIYDPRRAEIYARLGLLTVSSTSWGTRRVIQLLAHPDITVLTTLGNGEVELVEVDAPDAWAGRTVNDVNFVGELLVTGVTRRGRTLVPTSGTIFEQGDRVALTVLTSSIGRLEKLLGLG
ncbi:MAG TPA: TrkA family potassium uptake protein [Anaerolineae bacterium]